MNNSQRAVLLAYQKGYRVDENGQVVAPSGKLRRLYQPAVSRYSYYSFSIKSGRRQLNVFVHRLTAFQKYGERVFSCACVRHLDSNRLNNRPTNIALGTLSDNTMDQPPAVRRLRAAQAKQRYSADMINWLRQDRAAGISYRELQRKYGVPRSTLSYYLSSTAKKKTFLFSAAG